MKIGFDAKRAFNNRAGLGNFSRNTIAALSSLYPDDQLFLFNPPSRKSLFKTDGNSTEVGPDSFRWKLAPKIWRILGVPQTAKQIGIEIFHGLSHELPVGIQKTDIKTVVTIHDLIYLRYPEYFKKIDREIYSAKFRHACSVADRVHAISEQTKRDVIDYFGIEPGKIQVIYQSINPIFFGIIGPDEKQRVRELFNLPARFMLTVGTLEPRKNLVTLLEAMSLAEQSLPLVVVGKPTGYYNRILKHIKAKQEQIQVILLTDVIDSDLAAMYQMAELMVYPSFFEGFGLPVVEAQASGCPVITSNTSSLPEAGGSAALYINPNSAAEIAEAISTILEKTELRVDMIQKGKFNARRFTPINFATQLKQLYKSILNER